MYIIYLRVIARKCVQSRPNLLIMPLKVTHLQKYHSEGGNLLQIQQQKILLFVLFIKIQSDDKPFL